MTALALFLLVYAHHMGDMVFQTSFMAKKKKESILAMLGHIVIYTGTVTMALLFLSMYAWWKPILLFFGHLLVDMWKSRIPKDEKHWNHLYYDQAMHLIQILIIWMW